MSSEDTRWIKCRIENSGFGGERRFEVELDDGGKAVGTANIAYLRVGSKRESLDDNVPPYGESAEGWVCCRVIRIESPGVVLVEFPSSDVFHVSAEALAES